MDGDGPGQDETIPTEGSTGPNGSEATRLKRGETDRVDPFTNGDCDPATEEPNRLY